MQHPTTNPRISTFLTLAVATLCASVGCAKSRLGPDNPDVASSYRDNTYKDAIVTGQARKDYKDQGQGIDPKTLTSIEHTITSVYERDFERCLEEQMDSHGTRFMRAVFALEFTIATSGKVTEVKILKIGMAKQDARGAQKGELDSGPMKQCIHDKVMGWEFDPAPEAVYKHTYNGQVGEAF